MDVPRDVAEPRIAARSALLEAVVAASQRHGATALHLLGSLGCQTSDAFSDIDAWLTFPDETIDAAVRMRLALYRGAGDLLLTHEAASNRPLGGVYTLALYQTPAGPVQIDWYLAPQRTSRVAPEAAVCFEQVPVPRGLWQLDQNATSDPTLSDTIDWLNAMLFITSKKLLRGEDPAFLRFVGEAYRDVQKRYGLGPLAVIDPTSLAAASMLQQLAPLGDQAQRHAILVVEAYMRGRLNRV